MLILCLCHIFRCSRSTHSHLDRERRKRKRDADITNTAKKPRSMRRFCYSRPTFFFSPLLLLLLILPLAHFARVAFKRKPDFEAFSAECGHSSTLDWKTIERTPSSHWLLALNSHSPYCEMHNCAAVHAATTIFNAMTKSLDEWNEANVAACAPLGSLQLAKQVYAVRRSHSSSSGRMSLQRAHQGAICLFFTISFSLRAAASLRATMVVAYRESDETKWAGENERITKRRCDNFDMRPVVSSINKKRLSLWQSELNNRFHRSFLATIWSFHHSMACVNLRQIEIRAVTRDKIEKIV